LIVESPKRADGPLSPSEGERENAGKVVEDAPSRKGLPVKFPDKKRFALMQQRNTDKKLCTKKPTA
jgi:hypothetical protein